MPSSFRALAVWCLLFLLAFVGANASARYVSGHESSQTVIKEVSVADLPAEARRTVALIRKGGPFPYERDGAVFGNFEKLLPVKARGHYREYTVRTPGAKSRGARRIVAGKGGELYYTDDHYNSFSRIEEP